MKVRNPSQICDLKPHHCSQKAQLSCRVVTGSPVTLRTPSFEGAEDGQNGGDGQDEQNGEGDRMHRMAGCTGW